MNIFVSTSFSLELSWGGGGNYVILHYANVFIVEDNILWLLGGPSDHTGSHENWFQRYEIDHITHQKSCNGDSFPLVFTRFLIF